MDLVTDALQGVKEQFGEDGLRAIAAFMFSMGTDTSLRFGDQTWTPCDFVMQECWELGGDPTPKP